jgi:hypothetical protein
MDRLVNWVKDLFRSNDTTVVEKTENVVVAKTIPVAEPVPTKVETDKVAGSVKAEETPKVAEVKAQTKTTKSKPKTKPKP